MNYNPEDPKWTAYALGELDPAERAAYDAACAADPAARAAVEEIRAAARQLEQALAAEPALTLRPEQRRQVLSRPAEKRVLRFLYRPVLPLAAAAALVGMVSLGLFRLSIRELTGDEQQIAIGIVEPESIQLEQFEKELEKLEEMPDLVDASAPVDLETPPPAQEPSPASAPAELYMLAAASPKPSPLVMRGLFDGRSAGGRNSVLSRQAVGFARLKEDTSDLHSSGVISPSQDDFDAIRENPFQRTTDHPLSTFSIDVDSASYAVVRRFLSEGQLPPKDAVRIEELVNYFSYAYDAPTGEHPFAVHLDAAPCPWNPAHHLARIALKARVIDTFARPPLNLVFLLDVSGSMSGPNRLPLVKRSLQALTKQLDGRDRIAIVVYAGAAGAVLPTTSGDRRQTILEALENLEAGGSTAGGAGIQLAYETARAQFATGGVNRVILCTDGDFNVGLNQRGDLERLIETEAKSGVYLTVLGFGMGNYKDSTLELLSNKGNGNYGYVDDFSEARRLLVDQMIGTLVAVAKDVKIQVEFNPARVAGYRLIGYENRMLRKEDFNNDKVDAGDVGAGHTVTAFYELIPAGLSVPGAGAVDDLKYQATAGADRDEAASPEAELLTAKLRYKLPDGDTSTRLDIPLPASALRAAEQIRDFRFAAAVAGFGMVLRDAPQRGSFSHADVLALAAADLGSDPGGYRAEFLKLVANAQALAREGSKE